MADLGEENKVSGVFGGVEIGEENKEVENAGTIRNNYLPVKTGFWTKFKNFWLQEIDWNKEIKVELTPYQQKVEDNKIGLLFSFSQKICYTFLCYKLKLEVKKKWQRVKQYLFVVNVEVNLRNG